MAANKNGPISIGTAAAGSAASSKPAKGTALTFSGDWTALVADLDEDDISINFKVGRTFTQGPHDVAPEDSDLYQKFIESIDITLYEFCEDALTLATGASATSDVISDSTSETKIAFEIAYKGICFLYLPNCVVDIQTVTGQGNAPKGKIKLTIHPLKYTGYNHGYVWMDHTG